MNNANLIKMIKEEVNNFDFLSNDKFLKEQEITDLLQNEDLQRQFICDSLLNKNDKVKLIGVVDGNIGGNWDESNYDESNYINLEYLLLIEYRYDTTKQPLKFNLSFFGDKIHVNINSEQDAGNRYGGIDNASEPTGESWFDSFEWSDIFVTLITETDDEITFTAFENAPPKIKTLFIREYTQGFIESKTLKLKTPELKDNIHNTPYC